jgi:hypothetical protein
MSCIPIEKNRERKEEKKKREKVPGSRSLGSMDRWLSMWIAMYKYLYRPQFRLATQNIYR